MNGLIGYTGFVGGNIKAQYHFDRLYNSKNIEEALNTKFDLLVCAGISGTKWLSNKYPEKDLEAINNLLYFLKKIQVQKLVFISTVDVYDSPFDVTEVTRPSPINNHIYGLNRLYAEEIVKKTFDNYNIIRLPALFGKGLKKNFVFDMLNNHCLNWTHKNSEYQYYNLDNIWNDIEVCLKNDIKVLNINSEPISAEDLAINCFHKTFSNVTEKAPVCYNVKSIYTHCFNCTGDYIYTKEQITNDLIEFVDKSKRR